MMVDRNLYSCMSLYMRWPSTNFYTFSIFFREIVMRTRYPGGNYHFSPGKNFLPGEKLPFPPRRRVRMTISRKKRVELNFVVVWILARFSEASVSAVFTKAKVSSLKISWKRCVIRRHKLANIETSKNKQKTQNWIKKVKYINWIEFSGAFSKIWNCEIVTTKNLVKMLRVKFSIKEEQR